MSKDHECTQYRECLYREVALCRFVHDSVHTHHIGQRGSAVYVGMVVVVCILQQLSGNVLSLFWDTMNDAVGESVALYTAIVLKYCLSGKERMKLSVQKCGLSLLTQCFEAHLTTEHLT